MRPSYPLLRKVLVSFGDKVAFEDTLDEALDSLFGGDSGADGGDAGAGEDPTTPEQPGEDPGVPPTTPEEPGSGVDQSALEEALQDYQTALDERIAAYAAGDLVAAAEADQRMQEAIERAMAAVGEG